MIATISPRTRGSPVFCISILTAMSPVLYKAAWHELQVRNWSKARGRRAELNSRLTGGMAPNRTTTSSVSEALKERVGRLLAVAGIFSRKWSFTIPAEKARGERLFWESRLAAVRPVGEKVKAATLVTLQPSAPAREPTAWMHAPSQPLMRSLLSQFQTPTAPRRTSRFFRVWLLVRSPCRPDHSAYFGLARFISPILSAVDGGKLRELPEDCQRPFSVQSTGCDGSRTRDATR